MAKTRRKPGRQRPWLGSDIKKLKKLMQKDLTAKEAAKVLKRTEGAVKFKAFKLRLSFKLKGKPSGKVKSFKRRARR